jgi:hypothetical protein
MTRPIVHPISEEEKMQHEDFLKYLKKKYPQRFYGKMPKGKKMIQTPRKRGKSRIGKRRKK